MADNKILGKSYSAMTWVIRVMQWLLLPFLVLSQVDYWFFKGTLFIHYFRQPGGARVFIPLLFIVLFGGSALIIFLNMRSNRAYAGSV